MSTRQSQRMSRRTTAPVTLPKPQLNQGKLNPSVASTPPVPEHDFRPEEHWGHLSMFLLSYGWLQSMQLLAVPKDRFVYLLVTEALLEHTRTVPLGQLSQRLIDDGQFVAVRVVARDHYDEAHQTSYKDILRFKTLAFRSVDGRNWIKFAAGPLWVAEG